MHDEYEAHVTKLIEVNSVIAKLAPAIQAQAFELLKPFVFGDTPAESMRSGSDSPADVPHTSEIDSRETFFGTHAQDKPSENVMLIAAYHFGKHGSAALGTDNIRDIAADVGLIVPDRVDMTLAQAHREGKTLFRRIGKGQFKPTVHGEAYLKATYRVEKGRASVPATSTQPTAE